MKRGWLVNDTLTCIPNTKTFWHNLLEWLPGLIDKTGGHTNFSTLPIHVERDANLNGPPDYIIRNCTIFRKMNINTKTVSLLQDYYPNDNQQIDVANNSDVVVFNSPYTQSLYKDKVNVKTETISLGIDFDFFKPLESSDNLDILPNSILFIGANNNHPKGFDVVMDLINNTDYNFCLIMKDGFAINHPRVRVFNKVSQETVRSIANKCDMLICTSKVETLHLAGLEAAACGLPLIATNVGVYYGLDDGEWGRKASNTNEFISQIKYVFENHNTFNSRNFFLNMGYDIKVTKEKWGNLIESL